MRKHYDSFEDFLLTDDEYVARLGRKFYEGPKWRRQHKRSEPEFDEDFEGYDDDYDAYDDENYKYEHYDYYEDDDRYTQ